MVEGDDRTLLRELLEILKHNNSGTEAQRETNTLIRDLVALEGKLSLFQEKLGTLEKNFNGAELATKESMEKLRDQMDQMGQSIRANIQDNASRLDDVELLHEKQGYASASREKIAKAIYIGIGIIATGILAGMLRSCKDTVIDVLTKTEW